MQVARCYLEVGEDSMSKKTKGNCAVCGLSFPRDCHVCGVSIGGAVRPDESHMEFPELSGETPSTKAKTLDPEDPTTWGYAAPLFI